MIDDERKEEVILTLIDNDTWKYRYTNNLF